MTTVSEKGLRKIRFFAMQSFTEIGDVFGCDKVSLKTVRRKRKNPLTATSKTRLANLLLQ